MKSNLSGQWKKQLIRQIFLAAVVSIAVIRSYESNLYGEGSLCKVSFMAAHTAKLIVMHMCTGCSKSELYNV